MGPPRLPPGRIATVAATSAPSRARRITPESLDQTAPGIKPRSQEQHGVAEGVEAVALLHGNPVEPPRILDAHERHHEREERGARQVEVREERIDAAELEARRDEEVRAPGRRRTARERLEDAGGRRPDRGDPR